MYQEFTWIEVLKKCLQIHNYRSYYVGQLIEEDLYMICRIEIHATIRACDFIYHGYYYEKTQASAPASFHSLSLSLFLILSFPLSYFTIYNNIMFQNLLLGME